MKIYKIEPDFDCWSLLPKNKQDSRRLLDLSLPQEFGAAWSPLELYVRDPVRTKVGDFVDIKGGILVFNESVIDSSLGEIIGEAGEILEVRIEGVRERFYILHPLVCYNCFDRTNSEFRTIPDGSVVTAVDKYAFHSERVGGGSLFKIPETYRVELYTWMEREEDRNEFSTGDEFISQYEENGFTGLKFTEVWHS